MKINELNAQEEDNFSSATSPEHLQQIIDLVSQETPVGDSDIVDLSDVELRLEEANCYKALLRNPLFSDDAGVIARRVEKKVRDFIRTELKLLLGITLPPVKVIKPAELFEPEEFKALKMLAARVLNKPVVTEKTTPKEPTVNAARVEPLVKQETAPVEMPKKGRPRKIVKKVITLPNGQRKEVEIEETAQVQPAPGTPGRKPTMTPEQSAAYQTTVASLNSPKGTLGVLVNAVTQNNQ